MTRSGSTPKKPRTWTRWANVSLTTGQIARPLSFTEAGARALALDANLAYGTLLEPVCVKITEVLRPTPTQRRKK